MLHSSLTDPRTKATLRAITATFRDHRAASRWPQFQIEAPSSMMIS
jgi:hypothetical protein